MGKLRIAVFHNLHSGGAKRVTSEHLRRLGQRHHVTLYSLREADHSFAQTSEDARAEPVLEGFRPWPWLPSPFGRLNTLVGMANVARLDRLARRLAVAIDGGNFDVVLAHPCQVTQAPLVLRWLRTPSLYYCHELPRSLYEPVVKRPWGERSAVQRAVDRIDPLPAFCRRYYRAVDRLAAQSATSIAVNSHFTGSNVHSAYGRYAEVCSPGVDGESFQPLVGERRRSVLSVGALTPAKGFDFLVEAVATIPPTSRPPVVIISNYQDQREAAYLTTLASVRAVALQLLVGVTDVELQQWYAQAGCVAYTPVGEPFGLVPLEAMAMSAPLVSVSEGGPAETVIDGVTGLLAPREPEVFGKAVSRILDDAAYATRLGAAARSYVRTTWTWERHVQRLEEILITTASRLKGRPATAPGLPPADTRVTQP